MMEDEGTSIDMGPKRTTSKTVVILNNLQECSSNNTSQNFIDETNTNKVIERNYSTFKVTEKLMDIKSNCNNFNDVYIIESPEINKIDQSSLRDDKYSFPDV